MFLACPVKLATDIPPELRSVFMQELADPEVRPSTAIANTTMLFSVLLAVEADHGQDSAWRRGGDQARPGHLCGAHPAQAQPRDPGRQQRSALFELTCRF